MADDTFGGSTNCTRGFPRQHVPRNPFFGLKKRVVCTWFTVRAASGRIPFLLYHPVRPLVIVVSSKV